MNLLNVSIPTGEEGKHYVLTLNPDTSGPTVVHLYDGDDDYWVLANLIDRRFDTTQDTCKCEHHGDHLACTHECEC